MEEQRVHFPPGRCSLVLKSLPSAVRRVSSGSTSNGSFAFTCSFRLDLCGAVLHTYGPAVFYLLVLLSSVLKTFPCQHTEINFIHFLMVPVNRAVLYLFNTSVTRCTVVHVTVFPGLHVLYTRPSAHTRVLSSQKAQTGGVF